MRLRYQRSPTGAWQVSATYRRVEAWGVQASRADASRHAIQNVMRYLAAHPEL